jgi:hypothetical protein
VPSIASRNSPDQFTGLAHQAQQIAFFDTQAHAVHRFHGAKTHPQIAKIEKSAHMLIVEHDGVKQMEAFTACSQLL